MALHLHLGKERCVEVRTSSVEVLEFLLCHLHFGTPPPVRGAVLHHIHINCLYMTQFYAAIVNAAIYRNLLWTGLVERTPGNRQSAPLDRHGYEIAVFWHVHGGHMCNDCGIKGLLWSGGRPTDASSTLRATLQHPSATQVRGSLLQCDIGHGQWHLKIRNRFQQINGFRNVVSID